MWRVLTVLLLAGVCAGAGAAPAVHDVVTLGIGESFLIDSAILHETRRINVAIPRGAGGVALPVLYMPDGGLDEDFLHVAGLLQVGAGNGTTRPFLLVGIENTERRRDLTGPTANAKDRAIAPRVGGSAAFRRFIREELMPEVARRYRITNETAIVGESLAGLFVLETLALAPEMFDTYIAIDPSLWWNDGALARTLDSTLAAPVFAYAPAKTLAVATSRDGSLSIDLAARFAHVPGLRFSYRAWPEEGHATVYHPAALAAFREVLRPLDAAR